MLNHDEISIKKSINIFYYKINEILYLYKIIIE